GAQRAPRRSCVRAACSGDARSRLHHSHGHPNRKLGEVVTFLTIGLSLSPTWVRGQSWRRPDSRVEELFSAGPYVGTTQRPQAACLDLVFKPIALELNTESLAQGPVFSADEPIVLLTADAQATEHISVIPPVSSTYFHPYTRARQLQSHDHLSGGLV